MNTRAHLGLSPSSIKRAAKQIRGKPPIETDVKVQLRCEAVHVTGAKAEMETTTFVVLRHKQHVRQWDFIAKFCVHQFDVAQSVRV